MIVSKKKLIILLTIVSTGAPLLAAIIATNRFNTAKTNRIIPNTFIVFLLKGL